MSSEMITDLYPTRKNDAFSIMERKDPVVYDNELGLKTLDNEKVKFFANNGYLLFQNLFTEKEVATLFEELERLAYDDETKKQDHVISEPESGEVRSIFEIHKNNPIFKSLSLDKRIVNVVRQLLGSDVYITQSRINRKPGFEGKEFYWHSDFETWHAEDGMPRMRAISCSINLTENFEFNGPLMVIPRSHKTYISCGGKTPDNYHEQSLKKQEIGTPDKENLGKMAKQNGIVSNKGPAGSALFFDCNLMHGSGGNITPFPRSNVFFVYNSIQNQLVEPFSSKKPRPLYIASREPQSIIPSQFTC
jgi:ectoine hydroxylase